MRKGWIFIGVGIALLLLAGVMLMSAVSGPANAWALGVTGLDDARGIGLDGSGVRVAVIDTGFDPTHPSLKGIQLEAWRDYVNGHPKAYDDAGHGNHVIGILAGNGGTFSGKLQGFDLQGAAPGIGLIAVKAISKDGTGTSGHVADGIDFAIDHNADIICLSLGSRDTPLNLFGDEITTSVRRAVGRGILVVAAAGNTGDQTDREDVENPATIDDVIAVGAVDENKRVAAFSAEGSSLKNYGAGGVEATAERKHPDKKPEIVAPGVDILSAWVDGQYAKAKGTSQAAPYVCGALALLLQDSPELKTDNSARVIARVKTALQLSAEPVAGQRTPHDPQAGYGLLRADRLLDQL